ncbi:MAG TPA: DJ-1/PfpI family protein [Mesorhizobium sp.]|jgi:putative intracellular protease/amidase|nr:DJ-1/PfpI family protein [Mesorhizobium sp.]
MTGENGPRRKTLGVLFIHRWADREYGLLAASAADWFDTKVLSLAPGGREVSSASGFRLTPDRPLDAEANADLHAIAVIGSDRWPESEAPEVGGLLRAVAEKGGVVGGICAGTLPLARAGLFAGRDHTSNGREWIMGRVPGYAGSERYRDVPHAVCDRRIVSAPGSAPGTFACAFLGALYPEREAMLCDMHAMFAKEYGASAS